MKYEINNNGALEIFAEGQELPFILQPTWPNGDAWLDGEAEAWAEAYIASINDITAPMAGPSRDEPTVSRPALEDLPITGLTQRQLDELVAAKIAEALAAK